MSPMPALFDVVIHEMLNIIVISFAYLVFREIILVGTPVALALYAIHRLRRRARA